MTRVRTDVPLARPGLPSPGPSRPSRTRRPTTAPTAITVTWATGEGATRTTGVAAAAISSRGRSGVRRRAIEVHGLGHDGDRRDLQPVDRAGDRARLGDPRVRGDQAEDRHDQRAREREPEPGGRGAGPAGAEPADRDRQLAARRARQRLAQGGEVGERGVVDPAAILDERLALVAQVRDRTAERRQAQAQRRREHLEGGATRTGPGPPGRRGATGRRPGLSG